MEISVQNGKDFLQVITDLGANTLKNAVFVERHKRDVGDYSTEVVLQLSTVLLTEEAEFLLTAIIECGIDRNGENDATGMADCIVATVCNSRFQVVPGVLTS